MHALIENNTVAQYPYTIGNLRRDNPQTSFPKRPDNSLLAEWGLQPVAKVDYPSVDHTKNVVEGNPVLVGGIWTQVWNVVNATAEEITERTAQADDRARIKRDKFLLDTDWVSIKSQETGAPMSSEMQAYRQALRDITSHANWPHLDEADWPTKP